MLEAIGIPTAIMTSPGHVFLAFDSGESASNAWMFAAPGFRTVEHNGTLWVPVESTVLSDGFAEAWRSASDLVEKYSARRELGFLATAEARSTYPPLPLSPSILPAPGPDGKRLEAIGKRSLASLDSDVYKPVTKGIESERKKQTGAAWNRTGNRLAQLHARFGHESDAVAVLGAIAAKDPTYVPALLNLAGLAQTAGRKDESLAWLRRAAAMAPGSAVVSGYAKAIGHGEALGFGPAIVDATRQQATRSDGSAASIDRAAGPAGPGWAGE
jgi:hypothetical protein